MTDAEVLFRDRNGSRTRTEYPVIADVDGDFKAEIVFPTNNDGGSGVLDAGLEVWGEIARQLGQYPPGLEPTLVSHHQCQRLSH
jgi:hypothetical protein